MSAPVHDGYTRTATSRRSAKRVEVRVEQVGHPTLDVLGVARGGGHRRRLLGERAARRQSATTSTGSSSATATGRRWSTAAPAGGGLRRARRGRRTPGARARLGIDRGDRVAVCAPTCAEWAILQYASAKIGAILVCINLAHGDDELEYVLNQSGVCLLLAAQWFKSADYGR